MTAVRSVDSLKYGAKLSAYFFAVVAVGGGAIALGVGLALPTRIGVVPGTVSTLQQVGGGVVAFLGAFVLASGLFGLLYKLVADSVSIGVGDGAPTPARGERATEAPARSGDTAEDRTEPETADTGASPDPVAASSTPVGTRTGGTERSPAQAKQATAATAEGQADASGDVAGSEPDEQSFDEWVDDAATAAETGDPAERDDGTTSTAGSERPGEPERPDGEGNRREPSPGEIAFGTESGEPAANDGAADREPEASDDAGGIEDDPAGGADTDPEGTSASGDPLADPTDDG